MTTVTPTETVAVSRLNPNTLAPKFLTEEQGIDISKALGEARAAGERYFCVEEFGAWSVYEDIDPFVRFMSGNSTETDAKLIVLALNKHAAKG